MRGQKACCVYCLFNNGSEFPETSVFFITMDSNSVGGSYQTYFHGGNPASKINEQIKRNKSSSKWAKIIIILGYLYGNPHS